ncbi:MAG: putative toxin-antitoxin system toxin component, PIN family [Betaproteobacteria bacterium RIFCSPLOWO2_12_FULL_62_58]|nr:MAG: putative toxin-antitoxin system toxin component, PIN family [Betaproteobacteria bacterium RIFCSPLOWO2_12_FULL_62_58]
MTPRKRIVVDNNALVSRLLLPDSVPGRAVRRAVDEGQLLISEATLIELADVLARPKFDRYVSIEDRQQFLRLLGSVAELVPITYPIRACRDPRDDKFLELAINGGAAIIITGDKDLLALDPFQGIPIITPASFLKR